MAKSKALFIEYGTSRFPFSLQYSKRKTLGIAVTPDKKITVTAPNNTSREKILKKVTNRASWINKQIKKFEFYQRNLIARAPEYVSGETFYYLGRKYRLKVVVGEREEVKLYGKYLRTVVRQKEDKKKIAGLVMNWYRQQAKVVFAERFNRFPHILRREKIKVNQLMIRRMEKRWGSCTEAGNIVLNLSLVQAPVQCIDYVLVHEICHLKYLDHGKKYYQLLNACIPGWEKVRQKLGNVHLI